MNTIFTKITLLIVLLLPVLATAQTDDFYQLKSYNYINDLAIDSQYIWAATTSGVVQRNKATGEICGIFNASNSPLKSEDVTAVAIDSMGQKWFGTRNGFVYSFDDFEWVEEDSLTHVITDFAHQSDGEQLIGIFKDDFNSCGLLREGIYEIFQQENGGLWTAFQYNICGGSSSGCGCFYYPSIQRWNGNNWDTLLVDFVQDIRLADFVVTQEDEVWITHDSTLNLYQLQNDTLAFQSSIDLEIGNLNSISLAPNGDLWLTSEQGVFTFIDNNLQPQNTGLSNRLLNNIIFDNDENIYATSNYGLFRYENDVWVAYTHGLLSQNNAEAIFAKNGDVWFSNQYGMSLYDSQTIINFTIDNSILPEGINQLIHADSQSGIWLNKLDVDDNYHLFYHDGLNWAEINEQNSSLTDFHFTTIKSDADGQIWFEYANPTQDSVARFDGQSWESFATLNEYEAAFFVPISSTPPLWSFNGNAMVKNENGVITEFPIDNFPAVGSQNIFIISHLYTQEGYAWVVYHNFLAGFQNKYVTVFNGEEWLGGQSFYLQNIAKSFAKGNQAWFFTQDQVPVNLTTASVAYHYAGNQRTIMTYPVYCLSSVNNNELEILDFIEEGDDYWILYNLSRVYAGGPGASSCKSNVLVRMNGNVFTEIAAKDVRDKGLISKIQKDLDGNIWVFKDNGIATNRPLSPILETFSKPTLCNSGRALACVTSGGLPPFNYQWNDGTTNPLKAPANPGNYSVTVTDANATTQSSDLEIGGQGTFIDVQAAVLPISCAGEDDGHIEVFASGGTPPYQYLWADGTMQPMIEFLPPDEYALTVTDAEGCTATQMFEIIEPEELTLNLTSETPMSGESNGSVMTAVTGGTPPFSYLWNTGEGTPDLVDISGGNYSLTVTDEVGCTVEVSFYLYETALDNDTGMNLQTNTGGSHQKAIFFKQKQSKKTDREGAVIVFPNPFGNTFFIDFKNGEKDISTVEIYNVFGQKMPFILNENEDEGILKIETSEWSSGAYFVHYQMDGHTFVKKILKL